MVTLAASGRDDMTTRPTAWVKGATCRITTSAMGGRVCSR